MGQEPGTSQNSPAQPKTAVRSTPSALSFFWDRIPGQFAKLDGHEQEKLGEPERDAERKYLPKPSEEYIEHTLIGMRGRDSNPHT